MKPTYNTDKYLTFTYVYYVLDIIYLWITRQFEQDVGYGIC